MTVEDYIQYLSEKGFQFGEDAIGFITFGHHYTGASEAQVNVAIEITLKAQREFVGSFFISLLETLKENRIVERKAALRFMQQKRII